MDCFRLRSLSYGGQFVGLLLAMTASDVKSHPATRCVRAVERTVRPKNQRAQGMPGARCTRGLACKFVRKNAHEHTGSAEALRHSPRNGFTAYSVLFPATNSSCHRRQRINGMPGTRSGRHASANLTPATGARTTRLHRTPQHRSSARPDRSRAKAHPAITFTRPTLPRPPHPIPTFVTMANAPLLGTGWGELLSLICPTGQEDYFLKTGLTENH